MNPTASSRQRRLARRASAAASVLLLAGATTVASAPPAPAQRGWGDPQIEMVMNAQFDTQPGGQLRIDVADADLVLRTGTDDSVRFEIFVTAHDMERARARFEAMGFRAQGNDREVTLVADRRSDQSWSWRRWGRFDLTVEATLPSRYDVDAHSADGDLSVESVDGRVSLRSSDGDITAQRLAGTLEISTSDGDIGVRSIDVASATLRTSDGDINIGELRATSVVIDTSDGDVNVDSIQGGTIETVTGDGDIVLGSVAGPLQATTHDGSIHIGIGAFDETSLRTGDGDITIEAAEALAATLDLRGHGLSLHNQVRFDGTLTRRVIRGDLNGGGPTLAAHTGDGTIVLRLLRR